jgi:NADH:ubiquinone oxidoreductase subunit K
MILYYLAISLLFLSLIGFVLKDGLIDKVFSISMGLSAINLLSLLIIKKFHYDIGNMFPVIILALIMSEIILGLTFLHIIKNRNLKKV